MLNNILYNLYLIFLQTMFLNVKYFVLLIKDVSLLEFRTLVLLSKDYVKIK